MVLLVGHARERQDHPVTEPLGVGNPEALLVPMGPEKPAHDPHLFHQTAGFLSLARSLRCSSIIAEDLSFFDTPDEQMP